MIFELCFLRRRLVVSKRFRNFAMLSEGNGQR